MKKKAKNTKVKSDNQYKSNPWKNIDDESGLNADDFALFERICDYMKDRFDMEVVRNDPSHLIIDTDVKKIISEYQDNDTKNEDNEKFLKDSLSELSHENEIVSEIEDIKQEIIANDIDKISAEWVKEWNDKHNKDAPLSSKEIEIRNFISESLNHEKSDNEISPNTFKRDRNSRSYIIRIISLTAAAVLGLFIMFKILLPSSDPEKIYYSYYEPFNMVYSITRNATVSESDSYSEAVERYKAGDYKLAALGFSNLMQNDTSNTSPCFMFGITQMALGDFDKAINLLSGISVRSGEYHKDAAWYLGLAYLKKGEKEKAKKCFESLAGSQGFYSKRSGKILRRLK
jgi:TolA-binding protein